MNAEEHIPVGNCKRGHVYRLRSRNLLFGVFVPEKENGFIGIRAKFGSLFLFVEHHWDNGPPFGTVRPLEDLGPLEDPTIELRDCDSELLFDALQKIEREHGLDRSPRS